MVTDMRTFSPVWWWHFVILKVIYFKPRFWISFHLKSGSTCQLFLSPPHCFLKIRKIPYSKEGSLIPVVWWIRILKILYTMKCIRISLGKSVFFFFNCGSDSYCFICQCSWKNAWVLFITCEQHFLFIEVCRKQHNGIWSHRFISCGTWSQKVDRVNFKHLLNCELLNPDSLRSVWLRCESFALLNT